MATVVFTYNHARDPMNPAQLADQIVTALALTTVPSVDINATQIVVTHASVTESNRTAIQNLINVYVLDPAWAGQLPGIEASLRVKAQSALATNATFLAIANPTLAQTAAHAKALSRQNNAIIRLITGQTDSLAGT